MIGDFICQWLLPFYRFFGLRISLFLTIGLANNSYHWERLIFSRIDNISSTVRLWPEYQKYCEAVKNAVPQYAALRDKDRFLWGRSAAVQLAADIATGFSKDRNS
jgi:hypothetical protein